jgi:hypothetical protein
MNTMGQPPGSPLWNQVATAMTRQIRVVPSAAIDWAKSNMLSGSPQQAQQAALTMETLRLANPAAYEAQVPTKVKTIAHQILEMGRTGMPTEDGINLLRKNIDMDPTDRANLEQTWKHTLTPGPGRAWTTWDTQTIRRSLGSDPAYTTPGILGGLFGRDASSVPPVPHAMAAEFQDFAHQYYLSTGGDLTQAKDLAMKAITGLWGVDEVGGNRQMLKYAPTRMFPGLTDSMIEDDLRGKGWADPTTGKVNVRLATSPTQTEASGGRVWNLERRDSTGHWDVVRDPNNQNRVVNYTVPPVRPPTPAEQKARDDQRRTEVNRQAAIKEAEDRTAAQYPPIVP